MRESSEEFLAQIYGSNSPVVVADFWVGGELVREAVPVIGGNVSADVTQGVEESLTLTVQDGDVSDRVRDQIHAFGTQVNVRAGFDDELVSVGWFDVYNVEAQDSFIWLEDGQRKTGAAVTVHGAGLFGVITRSPFLLPWPQVSGADAWGVVQEMTADAGVGSVDPGFPAKTIPAGLVFDESRSGAVTKIAGLWDSKPVITSSGLLTLSDGSGDLLPDMGVRIDILTDPVRGYDTSDLVNGVVVIGKTGAGVELYGTAVEDTGLAAWGGPFGKRPKRVVNELMSTQSMVNSAARTYLANEIAKRSVVHNIQVLWNPLIELRDRVTAHLPSGPVEAVVQAYSLPFGGGGSSVTLRVPVVF